MADPLHQFQVTPIVVFGAVTLPVIGTQQIAFTKKYYGDIYDYYYKGHPATPTQLDHCTWNFSLMVISR